MSAREELGRIVRDEWVAWAREQEHPKPSWLIPWDELDESDPADAGQREVDMRIGEAVEARVREGIAAAMELSLKMVKPYLKLDGADLFLESVIKILRAESR